MGFGGFFTQLPAAAIQQAKVRRALEQAEEVFGCRKRFVDAQRAALVDLAEQAFHALQHAHGACLEEDLREFHVLIAGGHHQAMQVD